MTSPELGPLFGAVLARALDSWWDDLGRPDPYFLIEAGAGRGTLARAVLDADPVCAPALRYVLVERSATLRDEQSSRLPLEHPAFALGPTDRDDHERSSRPRQGPIVTALEDLPAGTYAGVVLANELLDNFPFLLLERVGDAWSEVRVGEAAGRFEEVLVPAGERVSAEADRHAPDAPPRSRIPLQHAAADWLRRALGAVGPGRVVVIDYAATTAGLAARPQQEWLRTYSAHGRGGDPLDRPGAQDITCDLCVDQLARVAVPDSDRSQAEFLVAHGLDELVSVARSDWEAAAARPDLRALAARSRVSEAAALTDARGLGAFRVLEWTVGFAAPS